MITLLHGENITVSRNALNQAIDEFEGEILRIDGKTVTVEMLTQALEGGSLFAAKKLVVIENITENKIKWPKFGSQFDLLFWESKEASLAQIRAIEEKFGQLEIKEFKPSTVAFKFVESLFPENQRQIFSFYKIYSQEEIPEIIFSMIVRQFRLMLSPSQLSGWQKDRITSQSKRFPKDQLKRIYKKLLQIDFDQKRGLTPVNLSLSLELFLLSL